MSTDRSIIIPKISARGNVPPFFVMEGIVKAKAEGVYKGRKPEIDAAEVRRLKTEGGGASEIDKRLSFGRARVYRILRGG